MIPLAIQASIVLIVFALGLHSSARDALSLFRQPRKLVRSLMAMNVLMPVIAAAIAGLFDLHMPVKIALICLAVAPVPPILPTKGLKAGGQASYVFGLLVAAALLAVVFVPVAVEVLARAFGRTAHISPISVARLVLVTVLAPMAAGVTVRRLMPAAAARLASPISVLAAALLVVSVLPFLFTAWPAIVSLIGNGTILAIAAFVLIGLSIGHTLGGPAPDDRTVLALCTATRHPGVALAIAHANFPEEKLVPAAVVLYLFVTIILSIPYVTWRRLRHGKIPAPAGP